MIARGWKRRQSDAKERFSAADEERAFVRAERARHAEEQRLLSLAQTEARELAYTERQVCCPVCDSGRITVERAELVIRAMERLPAGSVPDTEVLALLHGIATGTEVHSRVSIPLRNGLMHPRAADPGPAAETAHITPREEPVTAPRRKAVKVDPPWLDAGAVEEDD